MECHVNFDGQPSLIANNSTPYSGRGIHADGITAIASYVPVHFVNNTAREFGGAIYVSARNITSLSLSLMKFHGALLKTLLQRLKLIQLILLVIINMEVNTLIAIGMKVMRISVIVLYGIKHLLYQ